MQTIPIVYAADENFAMPLGVSIHSLVRRFSPDYAIELYIIDGGITDRSKKKLNQIAQRANNQRLAKANTTKVPATVEIHWVQPDMQGWFGQTLRGRDDLNEMTFYRLAMPHFLPSDATRALYVDSDFFFKADASVVFEQIPEDNAVVAVPDYSFPTHGRRYRDQPDAEQDLGFHAEDAYFNAGFLGINLDYWRENNIAGAVVKFLTEHEQYAWLLDQDAMNYALRGNWEPLDIGWNFQPTCRDKLSRRGWSVEERFGMSFEALQAKAKGVHFTGKKPWDQGFTNPERPFFEHELKDSGWFSWLEYLRWRMWWWFNVGKRAVCNKFYRKLNSIKKGTPARVGTQP